METNQPFLLILKSNDTDLGTISQSHRNQMENARAYSRSLELLDQERGKQESKEVAKFSSTLYIVDSTDRNKI